MSVGQSSVNWEAVAKDLRVCLEKRNAHINELEAERSVCEQCNTVRLFGNLTTPCPHCRIKELEAIMETLPDEVADRLFTTTPYTYVNRLVLETRKKLESPGWSKEAVVVQVREAIADAKEGAGT